MKTISGILVALSLTAFAVQPAMAASKAYCAQQARQAANWQAAGKTVVGAGLGCLLGAVISKKCGVGAAVGGVGGFAIGSVQWQRVYNSVYWRCRHS
jgi:hypothetical protein